MQIVVNTAQEYLRIKNFKADETALLACCKSWLKIKLPEAMRDAKEAMDCGMNQAAEMTFKVTLAQGGIEAAKEAGLPANQFDEVNS